MPRKRHTPEQAIRKLREAEVELAKGLTTGDVARKLGITEQTFYRWKRNSAAYPLRAISSSGHDDGSEFQFSPSVKPGAGQCLRQTRGGSGAPGVSSNR